MHLPLALRREIANILKFEVGEDPLLTAQLDIPSSVHGRLIGTFEDSQRFAL